MSLSNKIYQTVGKVLLYTSVGIPLTYSNTLQAQALNFKEVKVIGVINDGNIDETIGDIINNPKLRKSINEINQQNYNHSISYEDLFKSAKNGYFKIAEMMQAKDVNGKLHYMLGLNDKNNLATTIDLTEEDQFNLINELYNQGYIKVIPKLEESLNSMNSKIAKSKLNEDENKDLELIASSGNKKKKKKNDFLKLVAGITIAGFVLPHSKNNQSYVPETKTNSDYKRPWNPSITHRPKPKITPKVINNRRRSHTQKRR